MKNEIFSFEVKGTPIPSCTRNSRNDGLVDRYRVWQDAVRDAWKKHGGVRMKKIYIKAFFKIPGTRNARLSDLFRGVVESLGDYSLYNGYDKRDIRACYDPTVVDLVAGEMDGERICYRCEHYSMDTCGIGRTMNCPNAGVVITIGGERE